MYPRVPQHDESSLLGISRVLDMHRHHVRPNGPSDLLGSFLRSMETR